MSVDIFTWLGFVAGAVTSIGFIPQLVRGFKTKHLEDVSYWMPLVLATGMSLWLIYGFFRQDIAIVVANSLGVTCSILLLIMKKWYS